MKPMLLFNNLSSGYGKARVINNINLEFKRGTLYSIIGPNGSGKTTFIKTLLKETSIFSGDIFIQEKNLNSINLHMLSEMISFVPQRGEIPEGFFVYEILEMASFLNPRVSSESIEMALEICGIQSLKRKKARELSGGEQQLVLLARAICSMNQIILLDEPTNNLDVKNQSTILNTARNLADEGFLIIMTTHDINAVLQYSDNVIILQNGEVIKKGVPKQIITPSLLKSVFGIQSRIVTVNDETLFLIGNGKGIIN